MNAAEHLKLLFGHTPEKVVVAPLLLEIILVDGSRFFVHSLAFFEDGDELVIVKVWDMRTITGDALAELMARMNTTWNKDAYHDHEKIHPQLDWGIVSFAKHDLMAVVEWADRFWPVEMKERREKLGFRLEENTT